MRTPRTLLALLAALGSSAPAAASPAPQEDTRASRLSDDFERGVAISRAGLITGGAGLAVGLAGAVALLASDPLSVEASPDEVSVSGAGMSSSASESGVSASIDIPAVPLAMIIAGGVAYQTGAPLIALGATRSNSALRAMRVEARAPTAAYAAWVLWGSGLALSTLGAASPEVAMATARLGQAASLGAYAAGGIQMTRNRRHRLAAEGSGIQITPDAGGGATGLRLSGRF